ncbi:MAG: bifunctional oligoribonuclease/PAP phosphatase NrnA [Gemmataceae bacterium]
MARGNGGQRYSDRFLAGLRDASRVTLVSHVHPDPDALGAMLGLAHLVDVKLKKPTRVTRDGLINRAENRAMVDVLELPLVPIEEVDYQEGEAIVMVDSQPRTGRHNFDPDWPIQAVIDHHDTPGNLDGVPFVDIRNDLGATCSVVTRYLIEQNVELPVRLATALFYGIETELTGYPRSASTMDDSALHYLYPLADKELVAQIRNARLPQKYFECFLQAMQSSFIYDRLIVSWVHELPHPELAAEVCDFMMRFEAVDWALCAGVCKEQMILSLRSTSPTARAGEVMRTVVGKEGKGGGHDRRAGGAIPLASTSAHAVEELQTELRRRLLNALDIEGCRGQRLVPLREILQNL